MENHRTKFRGELKSSLKDDDLASGGEDLAPGGGIWREREIAAGESLLGENRSGREKTQVRRTGSRKKERGP